MKRLIGTIAVLFLFLIFAFFRSTDQAKKNQIPTVGILQLTSHPALDEIHRGIIAALKEEESETYLNYRMGVLSQKEYVSYKMKKEEQLQELETKKLDLTKRQKQFRRDSEEYEKVVRSLLKWKQEKELIEILIEKIYLYPDKRVEVVFSYTNPLIKRGTET